MADEIIKKPSPNAPKAFGLRAQIDQQKNQLKELDPTKLSNRLAIEFDNSGSMSGQPLMDAKTAVQSFTANCKQLETSIAIYPMNGVSKPLTVDYDLLNMYVQALNIGSGGTPLYTKLIEILDQPVTRIILFSDGEPTDVYGARDYFGRNRQLEGEVKETVEDKAIAKAKQRELAVDTIFIGRADTEGYKKMKWIAEQTGGIFIHFQDTKSLASGLKYLSPGLRGLLANPEIKAKLERGEKI